jgi:hypothetical protein
MLPGNFKAGIELLPVWMLRISMMASGAPRSQSRSLFLAMAPGANAGSLPRLVTADEPRAVRLMKSNRDRLGGPEQEAKGSYTDLRQN